MKWIANIDIDTIQNSISELHDIYTNIDEILAWLPDEKKAYYKSYLETTLALWLIPVKLNQANKFKGKGDSKILWDLKDFKKLRTVKVDEAAKIHILDWESWNRWWHRYWTGRTGKTEFPENWNDDKVINNIEDIISDKNSKIVIEEWGILQVFWTREGIDIKIVVDPKTERVITAFPLNTPRNP